MRSGAGHAAIVGLLDGAIKMDLTSLIFFLLTFIKIMDTFRQNMVTLE